MENDFLLFNYARWTARVWVRARALLHPKNSKTKRREKKEKIQAKKISNKSNHQRTSLSNYNPSQKDSASIQMDGRAILSRREWPHPETRKSDESEPWIFKCLVLIFSNKNTNVRKKKIVLIPPPPSSFFGILMSFDTRQSQTSRRLASKFCLPTWDLRIEATLFILVLFSLDGLTWLYRQ